MVIEKKDKYIEREDEKEDFDSSEDDELDEDFELPPVINLARIDSIT
jgi:hypothetical protein